MNSYILLRLNNELIFLQIREDFNFYTVKHKMFYRGEIIQLNVQLANKLLVRQNC